MPFFPYHLTPRLAALANMFLRLLGAAEARPVGAFSAKNIVSRPSQQSTAWIAPARRRTLIISTRTLATGSFWASAMYDSNGGCPAMLEYVSRWMLVFHSQLVVSGCPVPMNLAWRRSSSCWFRSLSAY